MNTETLKKAISTASESCCGGPAPVNSDACCVADATAKAENEDGCGCSTPSTEAPKKSACC